MQPTPAHVSCLSIFLHPPLRLLQEVQDAIEYGKRLVKFSNEDDLVPGLGLPTLHGGEFDAENRKREVKDLFRSFIEESVARNVSGVGVGGCICWAPFLLLHFCNAVLTNICVAGAPPSSPPGHVGWGGG